MSRGPLFSKEEKININRKIVKGYIPAIIARTLRRSKRCIATYLRDSVRYGNKKPAGDLAYCHWLTNTQSTERCGAVQPVLER